MTPIKEFNMDADQDVPSTTDPIGTVPQDHHPRGGPGDLKGKREPVSGRFSSKDPESLKAYLDHLDRFRNQSGNRDSSGSKTSRPPRTEEPEGRSTSVTRSVPHALGVTLTASLDRTITTEALRVYLGIAEVVGEREAKYDGVAYLAEPEVHLLSGVKPETLAGPRWREHRDSLARLGLVRLTPGDPGRMEDGHGMAGQWASVPSEFEPLEVEHPWVKTMRDDTDPLVRFLVPQSEKWTSAEMASSGWRMALVAVALCGLTRTPLSTAGLAEVLGVTPRAVLKTLARMGEPWDLVAKQGRVWVWDPYWLVLESEQPEDFDRHLTDDRSVVSRRLRGFRRPWLEQRDRWVTAKQAERPAYGRPMPYPPEPPLLSNLGGAHLSGEEDDRWHHSAA